MNLFIYIWNIVIYIDDCRYNICSNNLSNNSFFNITYHSLNELIFLLINLLKSYDDFCWMIFFIINVHKHFPQDYIYKKKTKKTQLLNHSTSQQSFCQVSCKNSREGENKIRYIFYIVLFLSTDKSPLLFLFFCFAKYYLRKSIKYVVRNWSDICTNQFEEMHIEN